MDEAELIRRSQAGEPFYFNQLVEAYQGPAYNLALRMLGHPQAAEDATQEAFLSAYQNIGRFRGGSFRAWLLRITANACCDQMRRAKKAPATSLDALLELENPPSFPTPEESPEEYTLRRELSQAIGQGLASLPPDQRLVLILSDIQGLSYEEIAQATKASLGTVKSRLSRGRAHLRDYLLRQGELLPPKFRPIDERS